MFALLCAKSCTIIVREILNRDLINMLLCTYPPNLAPSIELTNLQVLFVDRATHLQKLKLLFITGALLTFVFMQNVQLSIKVEGTWDRGLIFHIMSATQTLSQSFVFMNP